MPHGEVKNSLVSEFYEELLFQDPSALMEQLLTNSRPLTIGQYTHHTDCKYCFMSYKYAYKLFPFS